MYASITGTISETEQDSIVVDANGVGYEIFATNATISKAQVGDKAKFYTHLSVSETAQTLFGFATKEEKAMFRQLITVSGVGPKLAMAVLSGLSVSDLATAIITSDEKALNRVSGVGKKTAQRIILELKSKISTEQAFSSSGEVPTVATGEAGEAVEVLIAMGFDASDAAAAVALVKAEGGSPEQMAMRALRSLDRM